MQTVALLTAEEYARLPEDGRRTELVRGQIVELRDRQPRQVQMCTQISRRLGRFAESQAMGLIVSNDRRIVTTRDPDSVRVADLSCFGFAKSILGQRPTDSSFEAVPEIVFEVLAQVDRWGEVLRKIGECLAAGVGVVCVVNSDQETVQLYYDRKPGVRVLRGETLTFPDHLPGFSLPLTELFE